ncbi:MAG: hypothetical protein QM426_00025 [Euryarchaeota archaeon]|nr:hypothetical protein [Euryarchaeota archaeon]
MFDLAGPIQKLFIFLFWELFFWQFIFLGMADDYFKAMPNPTFRRSLQKNNIFPVIVFSRIIRKFALNVSVEALGMEIKSISMEAKDRKNRIISKIHF